MSLLNVIVEPDRVHMVTDTGVYGPDGGMSGFAQQKAFPLAPLNAVIGIRGNNLEIMLGALAYIYGVVGHWQTFDNLHSELPRFVEQIFAQPKVQSLDETMREAEIALIGWSESKDRPCGFFFHTTDNSPIGAFNVAPVDGIRLSPVGTEKLGAGIWPSSHAHFEQSLIAVAEQQRTCKSPPIIGGLLQLSTVKRDEIVTRIIHRWPEEVAHA